MTYKVFITTVTILISSNFLAAADLIVGQTCPVTFKNEQIGSLILSKPWYHSSRSNAQYIANDNATGVGIEIHLKNNFSGQVEGLNLADCDRFRLLQIRRTTAKLLPGEKDIQIDVPDQFMKQVLGEEFYPQDTPPAESMPEIVWTDSEQEEEQQPTPQTLTEETAQQLVPLLEEVRNLLKEMTTCGSIGVNMAGPQKDAPTDNIERKHGYLTSRKPKNKRDVLKQSIRDRLSRR